MVEQTKSTNPDSFLLVWVDANCYQVKPNWT